MKDRAPAFQFYPRQFAGDDRIMGMDLEAIGAHILLMCAAAASPEGCRIDADEYAIRMRLRNPDNEAWQRIQKQLLAGAWKVSSDGKWWTQAGLERTFQKQKEFSDRQRAKAHHKWGKDVAEPMPDPCRTDAKAMPEDVPGACSSSSSSSSKHSSSEQEACSDQGVVPTSKKPSTTPSRDACKLAALLKTEILRNKPDYRITPAQIRKWEMAADQLLRLDGRAPEQVASLIRWVQQNEFWRTNVLSMDTLREKFDQLEMKRGNSNGNGHASRTPIPLTNVLLDNPATRAAAQLEGD